MSGKWDNKETFGEWILKEVYFEDGWPSVMRDPIKKWVGLTDEEIKRLWSQSLADTEGETYLPLQEYAQAIETKLREKNT